MKLYAYKQGSKSAKALAQALGIKRIRHYGHLIHPKRVINWGASFINARVNYQDVINNPVAVAKASNKLETFKALYGKVPIPEWTDNANIANDLWLGDGHVVVARTKLNGHSGEGIEIYDPKELKLSDDGVNFEGFNFHAPLYTKYIPKKHEYRIHVFHDDAFFVQRKARKKELPNEEVNWKVRNHANGFIYAHQDVEVSAKAKEIAVLAVKTLGLDFGAVDMIYNEKQDKYYVLEVNTACGLEGETLNRYVEKFQQFR